VIGDQRIKKVFEDLWGYSLQWMQICQKDANVWERGREMFDSLSIKENTAEYAKKAKQTNRSRRLFE
jgi:hypothetical protein